MNLNMIYWIFNFDSWREHKRISCTQKLKKMNFIHKIHIRISILDKYLGKYL